MLGEANQILYQLGGGRFVSSVQAVDIHPCEAGLTFRLAHAIVRITSDMCGHFKVTFHEPDNGSLMVAYSGVTMQRMIDIFKLG